MKSVRNANTPSFPRERPKQTKGATACFVWTEACCNLLARFFNASVSDGLDRFERFRLDVQGIILLASFAVFSYMPDQLFHRMMVAKARFTMASIDPIG